MIEAEFKKHFGKAPEMVLRSPGRTELAGNHTDHQNGIVIAAAVNLFITAAFSGTDSNIVRIFSEGFGEITVDLADTAPREKEKGSSEAIVRGVAGKIMDRGMKIHGFDACITSEVLPGSGLSSSAAFENLIVSIFAYFDGTELKPIEKARISQFAENTYFGKPCGLMDQLASALGDTAIIDFRYPEPEITELTVDFSAYGYELYIIDCGENHSGLTEEYSLITSDLAIVSGYFGKNKLRDVDEAEFFASLPLLSKKLPLRAVMRAIHVFNENRRVLKQAEALKNHNIREYLGCVRKSGKSSWMYLQNIIPNSGSMKMAFALAYTEGLAGEAGACRVHGGGFAGTLQAYVPVEKSKNFETTARACFGDDSIKKIRLLTK